MNRKEIKEKAKSLIKGNIWNILWPMLVISVLQSLITRIFGGTVVIDYNNLESANMSVTSYFGTGLAYILAGIAYGGYYKYLLDFVRKGKFETDTIINTIKEKWLQLLIANILAGIIIGVCCLLFVVPGVIMALAYTFVSFIVIDSKTEGKDSLTKSREMMKGYKWDYFVFILSFIGWFILAPFTLFILFIWLLPYMMIAEVLYYEELKKISK